MATTKRELVKRISKSTGYKQHVAKEIIQTFLDEIVEELARGNRLEFREFGIFDTIQKRARSARNPRTGAIITVPAKTVVHFKVGRLMKKRVRELTAKRVLVEHAHDGPRAIVDGQQRASHDGNRPKG